MRIIKRRERIYPFFDHFFCNFLSNCQLALTAIQPLVLVRSSLPCRDH